jgi:shikimate kinase
MPEQGKTTIAKKIAELTKVPLIHVDHLYLNWCKTQNLPHTINVLGTWENQDKNTKDEFKAYLLSQISQCDLIIEGWQLESHKILEAIKTNHQCVVIRMWLREAYYNDKVVGNKDKLDSILQLCKFGRN